MFGKKAQNPKRGPRDTYRCSFCGKTQGQVARLIAGPGGAYICNECIDVCQEIIAEERPSSHTDAEPPGVPSPTPAHGPTCVLCNEPLDDREPREIRIVVARRDKRSKYYDVEYSYPCHTDCFRGALPHGAAITEVLEQGEPGGEAGDAGAHDSEVRGGQDAVDGTNAAGDYPDTAI